MHFIQKHILRQLVQHPTLRYSQLQMPRVETNKFTYHLRKLMRDGYVAKIQNGYKLTTKGVHHSTRVNLEEYTVRIQPKVVTLAVCKNNKGEFLTYRRSKQPFLHMIGFPYGKVHLGETVAEAAKRDLVEKTGFTATLTQKGIMYLLVTDKDGEVVEHMLCHVFFGASPKLQSEVVRQLGEVIWLSPKELLSSNYMPGVLEVFKMATNKKQSLQFAEYSFESTI